MPIEIIKIWEGFKCSLCGKETQQPEKHVRNHIPELFSKVHHELAIVNNSGLFFTLASLREHGKAAHPHLNVVIPEFWIVNLGFSLNL